jgi:hypothetical protein
VTSEQHAQRIRQIELQLYIADNGLGMPRDYQRILYLRDLLTQAQKDAANDNAAVTGYDIEEVQS